MRSLPADVPGEGDGPVTADAYSHAEQRPSPAQCPSRGQAPVRGEVPWRRFTVCHLRNARIPMGELAGQVPGPQDSLLTQDLSFLLRKNGLCRRDFAAVSCLAEGAGLLADTR